MGASREPEASSQTRERASFGQSLGSVSNSDVSESASDVPEARSTTQVKPINCLVVGMAGSGKSSLVSRLVSQASEKRWPYRAMNLDPAVRTLAFTADLDIRDTVSYSRIMEEYRLGPNGAILTALNLFAAQFERVLEYIEQACSRTEAASSEDKSGHPRRAPPRYIFFDTPGQIEAFTWSASGMIVTETLAAAAEYPTVLLFVVDIPRCVQNVLTFTSNMLYACSMLYRSRIPLIIVWNKQDCVPVDDAARLESWMRDFESFDAELEQYSEAARIPGGGDYSVSFSRSLALALNEFYHQVPCVFVSARTGEGMDSLFEALESASDTFEHSEYIRQVRERKHRRATSERNRIEQERGRFLQAHRSSQMSVRTGDVSSTRPRMTSRDRLRTRLQAMQSGGETSREGDSEEEVDTSKLREEFQRLRPGPET